MITAVYLENPFKPQNRVIRQISAAEAPAVIDAIALLNADLSGEMILSVNGQKVAADHLLKDGDFVVIAPNVLGGGGGGGKNIAGIVAGIALMAFSGGAGAGLLGILGTTQGALGLGVALYFGGALLMGNQKAPSVDAPRMQGAFENGYNWSPNQIRLQPGSPMPITFGTIRTSGQLIARRVWSAEFGGKQTQYLGLLLAAGEGPLTSIADIEINDTPIASIQGATYEVRLGTNNQNPVNIAGLGSTVEFQPFSSELPLSDSAWITKAQTEPGDKITLDFVFPAGLYWVDTNSGATMTLRGTIRWQYREVGSSSWLTGATTTYAQSLRRPFYFSIDFTPPDPSKCYEFRAQNYTLQDGAATYGGWIGLTELPGNCQANINWVGLTVRTNYAQTYPGVALVAISLPATENLSGSMPKVSWKQTRATVNVWNPNTSQYEQRDAQNVAWMVYYLIHYCRDIRNLQTNVDDYVVFGEPKENLNYDAFSAWATFCAYEVSAGVQRAFGALLVDSAEQMWPAIQKIASTGRAFVIQQAGVFKPVWDSTRTMSQIFTSGNIIDGSLSGSFLPERERANAIEVSFINAENGYERDTLFVPGDDYSPANMENTTQVFLPGITSPKIAYMWAKHQLKKNKYLKRTATLQADIDSIVAELGDVVGIQSDITSWGVGGRIMGATTTSVVIDQAVTLAPGSTYSLLIRDPDDTLVRRVVDAVLVSTTTTTLNFTGAPWPTAPERYCIYSFGINTLETKPFQITGIRRNGDLQASLELLEYIEDVYTEATDFPVIDYTAANAGISSLTVKADSDTGKLGIAWTIPTDRDYTGSVVYVDGKPQGFFTTDVTDIDIDAPPGTHTVTVRPVDGSGNYGTETEEEVTLGSPTLSSVSAPSLSSTVRGQADGTNLVYITGTFTIPDLASSVLVEIGEGSNPAAWATVQDSRVAAVQYGPVLPGTLYTLRFTAKNRYATADPVLEPITTAGDTTAPNAPSIGVTSYLKTVKIAISLASVPSDMAGFTVYRHTSNNSAAASQIGSITSKDGRATYTDEAPAYGATYYYWVKSFDTWGNISDFSNVSPPMQAFKILDADILRQLTPAESLNTDPYFADYSAWAGDVYGSSADSRNFVIFNDSIAGTTGFKSMPGEKLIFAVNHDRLIPYDSTRNYVLFAYMRATGGSHGLGFAFYDSGKSLLAQWSIEAASVDTNSLWQRFSKAFTSVPAGTAFISPMIICNNDETAGVVLDVQKCQLREVIASDILIANEAVITNTIQILNGIITNAHITSLDAIKITSGTIDVGRLAASIAHVGQLAVLGRNLLQDPSFLEVPKGFSNGTITINGDLENVFIGESFDFGGWSIIADESQALFGVWTSASPMVPIGNGIHLILDLDSASRAYIGQRVKIMPLQHYSFSTYIAILETAANIDLVIAWYNGETYLSKTSARVQGNVDELQRVYVTGQAPAGATHAIVYIHIETMAGTGYRHVIVSAPQFEYGEEPTAWVGREQGTITAERIFTGLLKSLNYEPPLEDGDFAEAGTLHDLNNGTIVSKSLILDKDGNLKIRGDITGSSGNFTGDITGATGEFSGVVGSGPTKFNSSSIFVNCVSPVDQNVYIKIGEYAHGIMDVGAARLSRLRILVGTDILDIFGSCFVTIDGTGWDFAQVSRVLKRSDKSYTIYFYKNTSDNHLYIRIYSASGFPVTQGGTLTMGSTIKIVESVHSIDEMSVSAPAGTLVSQYALSDASADEWHSGSSFYRKQPDGWIEQGGIAAGGSVSVTFPLEFADTNYNLQLSLANPSGGTYCFSVVETSRTAAGFTTAAGWSTPTQHGTSGGNVNWIARGFVNA